MESKEQISNLKTLSLWQRIKVKLSYFIHHKDPPYKIAMGVALGMFVGMLPIMGIQMLTVTLVALPFKANIKIAMATVWFSNPFTFIPLYWMNYKFGLIFVPNMRISWTEFEQAITKASAWDWGEIGNSFTNLLGIGGNIMVPLWIGSAVLGLGLGLISYVAIYHWVVFFRKRVESHSSDQSV